MADVYISLAELAIFRHVLDFDQVHITSTDKWAHIYVLPDCYRQVWFQNSILSR